MTNPLHRSCDFAQEFHNVMKINLHRSCIRAAWEARKVARSLERKDQPTNAARARPIQRAYMDEARKLKEKQ